MTTSTIKARAYASPSVALLAVKTADKVPEFAGWAIKRHNIETGEETWLMSMVPFKGKTNPNWEAHPTTEWPIQKTVWKDFQGPKNTKLKYGFVQVFFDATSANGVRFDESKVTWTNEITLTTDLDDEISVAFTNGFLSTQWLARQVPKLPDGGFDFATLLTWLSTPKNAIRVKQAGDVLPLLMSAIQQARAEGGRVHLVLYEFTDEELIQLVIANADVVSIILGNAGKDNVENNPTLERLKAAGVAVIYRNVGNAAIPHNKYVVYVDAHGKMCYIISGSTNWTTTGLTCQMNMSIRFKHEGLTKLYMTAAKLLEQDSAMHPTQSAWLRARFAVKPPVVVFKSGARMQVFFSPNTKERQKPKGPHPMPMDRAFGSRIFRATKKALTALFFMPGNPSYVDDIRWLDQNNPDMSVLELAVSSAMALQKGDVLTQHRPGQPPVAVVASAIEKAFADYVIEILKMPDAFAIIHSKTAQGDARHPNRWMVWCMGGSHNGGDTASFKNDENCWFIFGHRGLGIAMMVNHMDVTDHYRFREMINQNSKNEVLQGYLSQDDSWQDKYFVAGNVAMKELDYLTADDEPEADGPFPDFLQEDPDPQAFDKWGSTAADWEAEAVEAEKVEMAAAAQAEQVVSEEPVNKPDTEVPVETPRAKEPAEKPHTTETAEKPRASERAEKPKSSAGRVCVSRIWATLKRLTGRK